MYILKIDTEKPDKGISASLISRNEKYLTYSKQQVNLFSESICKLQKTSRKRYSRFEK